MPPAGFGSAAKPVSHKNSRRHHRLDLTQRTHLRTTLGGALFFPQLAVPTGTLTLPTAGHQTPTGTWPCPPENAPEPKTALAYHVEWERGFNRARYAADPPPF